MVFAACTTSAPPPPPEPEVAAPVDAAARNVYVTASVLNVRMEATTRSEVVTTARRGEKLEVIDPPDSSGAWIRVETASGARGWVAAQHVSSSAPRAARSARRRRGCRPDSDYRFVKTPTPRFSDSGAHGLVVVEANVDASGVVRSTNVISNSTGDEALGVLAEREIRDARFEAPVRDCAPRAFIFTYKRSF
jgi:TonB family protein